MDDFEARMREFQEQVETELVKAVPTWIWLVSASIPLLFMAIGLYFVFDAVRFSSEARSAHGTVIDVEYVPGSKGGGTYRPTIRFQRDDGRILEVATQESSSEYDYDRGAKVDVLYTYDDPEDMRIDSFFGLYGFGLIFAAFGAVFLALIQFARKMMGRMPAMGRSRGRMPQEPQPRPAPKPAEPAADLSKYGHAHKPKPEPTPTVRRNR